MTRLAVSVARRELSDVVSRVAYGNERVILERNGKEAAALISLKELRLLDRILKLLEDRDDIRAVRAALAEPGDNITYEKLRRELGLAD